jgi:iron complex transport system substrate-binding protein
MVEHFEGIHKAILNAPPALTGCDPLENWRSLLPSFLSLYNSWMDDAHYPQRIACLQPSATAILSSIGELHRIVACTKYCLDVVPELKKNAQPRIIADSWTSKSAEILAARPDLVIAAVPYQEAAVVEILKAGIRFLGLAPRTLEDIYSDIALIAGAVGAPANGVHVIKRMQKAVDEVRVRSAQLPRKRVFCEEWGKPIIASQTWVREMIEACGAEFLGDPSGQYSVTEIAQMNPEVMIASWCGAGDRVPLEKIVRQRGWSGLAAVRDSQVYCISDELLNTPAPTLIFGLKALAGAIHPGAFGHQAGVRSVTQVPETALRAEEEFDQIDLG